VLLQPASRAVAHEPKGCGVSFGPKGSGARALLERLQQVHAAHRAQRALLRQGYQQTVGALSRMHSAALAEANAAAHRRTAELAMISRQHETLAADVEARRRRRLGVRRHEGSGQHRGHECQHAGRNTPSSANRRHW
jgi:hypothetical protein